MTGKFTKNYVCYHIILYKKRKSFPLNKPEDLNKDISD